MSPLFAIKFEECYGVSIFGQVGGGQKFPPFGMKLKTFMVDRFLVRFGGSQKTSPGGMKLGTGEFPLSPNGEPRSSVGQSIIVKNFTGRCPRSSERAGSAALGQTSVHRRLFVFCFARF